MLIGCRRPNGDRFMVAIHPAAHNGAPRVELVADDLSLPPEMMDTLARLSFSPDEARRVAQALHAAAGEAEAQQALPLGAAA